MRVRCIANAGSALPEELLMPELGYGRDSIFAIVIGKEYVVYALTVRRGHLWYYICDENYTDYPVWKPAPLFEVSEGRLPSCWRLGFHGAGTSVTPFPVMAFPEWVDDALFYDRLTDGDAQAVQVFQHYKALLDAEP